MRPVTASIRRKFETSLSGNGRSLHQRPPDQWPLAGPPSMVTPSHPPTDINCKIMKKEATKSAWKVNEVPGAFNLKPINANVHSVHLADGAHVGNLKRVGAVWKFKAVGYDQVGAVEPGGGPLTNQHNMVFAQPDAIEVSARLLASLTEMRRFQ